MSSTLELENKPIPKLLFAYAWPAIIAMTASSLYNMADSIFIGQGCGAMAIAGLAVTFPFMNLSTAFGTLVGVGANTIMSISLGRHDYTTARKVLANVVALNVIIGLLFMVVSLIFLDPILLFFGASEQTLPYAREYMRIILYGNIITHIYFGLNGALRSASHPKRAMIATFVTVILNIILDPLFIFGFGWGIKGAAWATILSQSVSLIWVILSFTNKKDTVYFEHPADLFHLNKKIVWKSFAIGLSPFCMNVAGCVVVVFINKGLSFHGGDLAIGAYGIINRVVFVILMIIMGLNQGMQPIASYNFGAKKMDRLKEVISLTIKVAVCVTTCGCLVCELFPYYIARSFTSDQGIIEYAIRGMRLSTCVFPVIGAQIVITQTFQSLGMASKSIFLSLTRQVLFLIPCLIILPRFLGTDGVWISMPIADFIAALISWVLYSHLKKKVLKG